MKKEFKRFLFKDPAGKNKENKLIKIAAITGIVVVAGIILTRKAKGRSTILDNVANSVRNFTSHIAQYATRIKDRLLHNIKGPNGEDVFCDMYNRFYYVNEEDKRVYLDNE